MPTTFGLLIYDGAIPSADRLRFDLNVDLNPASRALRRLSSTSATDHYRAMRSSSLPAIPIRPLLRRNTISPSVSRRSYAEAVRGSTESDAECSPEKQQSSKPLKSGTAPININVELANNHAVSQEEEEFFEQEFPPPKSPPASPRATFRKLVKQGGMQSYNIMPPVMMPGSRRARRNSVVRSVYEGAFASAVITGRPIYEDGSAGENIKLQYAGHFSRRDWDQADFMRLRTSSPPKIASDMSATYAVL